MSANIITDTPSGKPMPIYPAAVYGGSWHLPDAPEPGDYAVSVPPWGELNGRTLFNISGEWWVQWPGFAARRAECSLL